MNEADTCRTLVRPKLEADGWDTSPRSHSEQTPFTDGRIIAPGGKPRRLKKKFSDFLLRDTRDITLAVVETKAILSELLDKYADHGATQFIVPDVLEVPPLCEHGNVVEIAKKFGGSDKLSEAVKQLQALLYAA